VIHPRVVCTLLTLREWLCLCDQVDAAFGAGRKFDVVRIDRGDKLEVTVSVEGIAGSAVYSMQKAA